MELTEQQNLNQQVMEQRIKGMMIEELNGSSHELHSPILVTDGDQKKVYNPIETSEGVIYVCDIFGYSDAYNIYIDLPLESELTFGWSNDDKLEFIQWIIANRPGLVEVYEGESSPPDYPNSWEHYQDLGQPSDWIEAYQAYTQRKVELER